MIRHFLIVLQLLMLNLLCRAQVTGPDTVCVGTPADFGVIDTGAVTHTWNTEPVNITNVTLTAGMPVITGMNGRKFMAVANDNGWWHGYLVNVNLHTVSHLDFGNDPENIPVVTNMGNFGLATTDTIGGVDVVRDLDGSWYVFVASRNGLLRLSFGNSLNNTPVSAILSAGMHFAAPYQLSVKYVQHTWVGFVANRDGAVSRLDFNLGLNAAPLITNLPLASYQGSSGFSLVEENGSWYMILMNWRANISNSEKVTRLDFSPDIHNNLPTSTYLPTVNWFGGRLTSLIMVKDCERLMALVVDEFGYLYKWLINSSILTPATNVTLMGPLTATYLVPYIKENEMSFFMLTWPGVNYRNLQTYPMSTVMNYYNNTYQHTFDVPGTYSISVLRDEGKAIDLAAYCKEVVVIPQNKPEISDTALCLGNLVTLDATTPGAAGYTWNTGDTTAIITTGQTGTYIVAPAGVACPVADTAQVVFYDLPVVQALPKDVEICRGERIRLSATGAEQYHWQPYTDLDDPFIAGPVATPEHSMTYLLQGTDQNGCTQTDSLRVIVHPLPVVTADAAVRQIHCDDIPVQLQGGGALSYKWYPAAYLDHDQVAAPWAIPPADMMFYVTGTDIHGCSNMDSIFIDVEKNTLLFVPNAFSPNGDGINDLFVPVIYCDLVLEDFSVFNRFGQKVFKTSVKDMGWDGRFKNGTADMGTYYWYLKGKNSAGMEVFRKGDVTLTR